MLLNCTVPDAAPRNIEVANISANDLSVSWERPDEIGVNGILRNYIIEYYITNQPDNSTATFNVSGSTLSTQLTELNNFTEYTVSVSAYTIGQGPAATGADATSENGNHIHPYLHDCTCSYNVNVWFVSFWVLLCLMLCTCSSWIASSQCQS